MRIKIFETFNDISKERNSHRHRDYIYIDKNVMDSQFADTLLKTNLFKNQITKYGLEKLKKLETNHSEMVKNIGQQMLRITINNYQD